MTTLEDRVIDAIESTGYSNDVVKLSGMIGVSKQAVYDWKNGRSIRNIKGKHLIGLSELSGYEPLWIMLGKGPKKRNLTDEQQKILLIMQESKERESLVFDLVEAAIKYQKTPDNNMVDDVAVFSDHETIQKLSDRRQK